MKILFLMICLMGPNDRSYFIAYESLETCQEVATSLNEQMYQANCFPLEYYDNSDFPQ